MSTKSSVRNCLHQNASPLFLSFLHCTLQSPPNEHIVNTHCQEQLGVLTPELFYPLAGFVEEVFCLLLHIHGLLVDAVQTSRLPPKRVHLHLQLAVPIFCVVEALGYDTVLILLYCKKIIALCKIFTSFLKLEQNT